MQQPQYVPGTTRLKDTELVVPVATGTVAFHLGKKASEFQSHRWTCYVRSPQGGDLSHVLRAVTFTLHPSFQDHVRTVEAPPFELTETGWGEFDIGVTVSCFWSWCFERAQRRAEAAGRQ
jgi:YEATS domain-containing protein 4